MTPRPRPALPRLPGAHLLWGAAMAALLGCTPASKAPAGSAGDASLDPRTAVALPAEAQQAVLAEMRALLDAISNTIAATAAGDTTALLAALAPAGSAAAADPGLEALLPPEWHALAERTHGGFDSIATAVRRNAGAPGLKDTVLVRLAEVGGACKACHEAFRVAVRPT